MFGITARRSTWATARLARSYAATAPRPEVSELENGASPDQISSSDQPIAGPSRLQGAVPTTSSAATSPTTPGKKSKPSPSVDENGIPTGKRQKKPRTPAQRAAFQNARAFALAMQQTKAAATADNASPPPVSVSASSRRKSPVEESIEEPTLADLLAKKPNYEPPSPLSKRYPKRYDRLVRTIDRAFVKAQLITFAREMGLQASDAKSKSVIIARILKSWGWLPPEEHAVERELQDRAKMEYKREIITYDMPGLTAADAHLFLTDAQAIDQMVRRNQIKITILRPTDLASNVGAHARLSLPGQAAVADPVGQEVKSAGEEPVILRTIGHNTAIKHLEEFLRIRVATKQHVDLPLSDLLGYTPPAVLMAAVSRATMTFVEQLDSETLRITGMKQDNMKRAEGLLLRAAIRRLPSSQPSQSLLITPAHTHPRSTQSDSPSTSGSASASESTSFLDSLLSIPGIRDATAPTPPSAAEDNYSLLPFTAPSNVPLPWHVAAEMQASTAVRLSQARMWTGYNSASSRMLRQEREDMKWGSVRVLRSNERSVGVDNESMGNGAEIGEEEGVKRLHEVFGGVDTVGAGQMGEEAINTLSFGNIIYSSHLGPLDSLLMSTPLDELPSYIKDMNMPIFTPNSTPRMIHEHLEGPRTTTRYLRYRPITPPTPLNAPLYARSLYPVPSSSTPSDTSYINSGEVYEFTYTLPTPPNPELDAARLDAEFGDLSIRSDMLDGPIRDKVSPKEPSDWVSQLEAQLDAEERRRRAERDEAVNGEQDKGSEELYKDASAIPGDEDLDLGGIEDGEVRGNARIVEAAEMGDSTAAPKAETETPALPALEVISTLSIPHTALLHVPNRTNDILFTSSLPRPADVPSPITHFFQLIHEAAHRDLAPRRAESGFSEDDDLWHEEPKAQVTYDPPPRFQIRIDGVVRHFGLEVDEERTVVGFEHAGVEVRGVERREMGVPWAKAVMCTEIQYKGTQPPEALWSQLNRISMDAAPNAVKASRGEIHGY